MFGKFVFVLVAAAFLPAMMPVEPQPEVLTRTGKWVADYDRDGCHLLAEFGADDAKVTIRFTRYDLGDKFDLSFYGKRLRLRRLDVSAKIDFGLSNKPVQASGLTGDVNGMPALFFNSVRLDGWEPKTEKERPSAVTPEQEGSVNGVTLAIKGEPAFRLEFGSLAKPFASMRDCMTLLVRSWGYDPEVQATLRRRPKPSTPPIGWLDPADYPSEASASGRNGLVQFRMDIDEQGKLTGCYILARTIPDDFDKVTCRGVMRRGKFVPALDAQGKPVRSYSVEKILWRSSR